MDAKTQMLLHAWANLLHAIMLQPMNQRGMAIADLRSQLDELYAKLLEERKADARSNKNA